jgi:hypothetical protein
LVELLEQQVPKPVLNVHQIPLDLLRQILAKMAALPLHLKPVLGLLRGSQRFPRGGLVNIVDEAVAPFLSGYGVVDVHSVEHLSVLEQTEFCIA